MATEDYSTVFALLSEGRRALNVVREAEKEGISNDPVVRGIIDTRPGDIIDLAYPHPGEKIEERIIRVETRDPFHVQEILHKLRDCGVECVLGRLPGRAQVRRPSFWPVSERS